MIEFETAKALYEAGIHVETTMCYNEEGKKVTIGFAAQRLSDKTFYPRPDAAAVLDQLLQRIDLLYPFARIVVYADHSGEWQYYPELENEAPLEAACFDTLDAGILEGLKLLK